MVIPSKSRGWGSGLVAIVVLLVMFACGGKKGALIVAVSTDMKAPKDVSAIAVSVATNGSLRYSALGLVTPLGDVLLPSTLAVAEPDDPNAVVRIRVIAFQNRRARVMRDVRTTVPRDGKVSLLRIPLSFVNDGSVIGDLPGSVALPKPKALDGSGGGTTDALDPNVFVSNCMRPDDTWIDGECQDAAVDSSSLPPYSDQEVFGPGGTATDTSNSCFDTQKCFAAATVVSEAVASGGGGLVLDRSACSIALGMADPSALNLAIVTPETGECLRDGACYVPLDRNATWHDESGVAKLAPIVCKLLGKGFHLEASVACAAKVESTPLCLGTTVTVPPDAGGDGSVEHGSFVVSPASPSNVTSVLGGAQISVKLSKKPAAEVTTAAATSTTWSTATPASLVFTPANWDTPQVVTIASDSPLDDPYSVTLSATSADPAYAGVRAPDVHIDAIGTATFSTGQAHTCFRFSRGAVKCWGLNSSGQLGNGDTLAHGVAPNDMGAALPTVQLGTGRRAAAISAGSEFTCALLDEGSIKCWGLNQYGQLGQGSTQNLGDGPSEMGDALPRIDLGAGRTAKAVTAGELHACALLDDASIKCWGHAGYGEIGSGDQVNRGDQPNQMGDALLRVDLGPGRTARAVRAIANHTCALLDDDSLKCWGTNATGELGYGDNITRGFQPGQMGAALPVVPVPTKFGVVARIARGYDNNTCVETVQNALYCWGGNGMGELGLGDTNGRGGLPGEVAALPSLGTALMAAVGQQHVCALGFGATGSTVSCWGANNFGQLGRGDTAKLLAPTPPNIDLGGVPLEIDLGWQHGCAKFGTRDAKNAVTWQMKCWGQGAFGELGYGDQANRGDSPGQMGAQLPFVDIGL